MGQVSRAPQPSFVRLPDPAAGSWATIYEFLVQQFPHVGAGAWGQRIRQGEVSDAEGRPVTLDTPYRAGILISYFRSVQVAQAQPDIPILFEDDEILVADKPHGISVTPTGSEVGGCLLYLLWDRSPARELTPVHRIDRDTAGVVLFVKRAQDRSVWQGCFERAEVDKLYFASSIVQLPLESHYWCVRSRISAREFPADLQNEQRTVTRADPPLAPHADAAADSRGGRPSSSRRSPVRRWSHPCRNPNACSEIYFAGVGAPSPEGGAMSIGRFWIRPRTGKQHQIRLHLASLGYPILGDCIYGRPSGHPLQLHSAELILNHPRTGQRLRFQSLRSLAHWGLVE